MFLSLLYFLHKHLSAYPGLSSCTIRHSFLCPSPSVYLSLILSLYHSSVRSFTYFQRAPQIIQRAPQIFQRALHFFQLVPRILQRATHILQTCSHNQPTLKDMGSTFVDLGGALGDLGAPKIIQRAPQITQLVNVVLMAKSITVDFFHWTFCTQWSNRLVE